MPAASLPNEESNRREQRCQQERPFAAESTFSELVAKAGAHRVQMGVRDLHEIGREADIFPLGTHEEVANQVDVDAKTGGIAIDQVIVRAQRRTAWRELAEWPALIDTDRVQQNCRAQDVRVPERESTKHVWQETAPDIGCPGAESRHVGD